DRLRLRQIDGGRLARDLGAVRAIGVASRHRVLVLPHLVQVDGLRLSRVELGELVQRLGLLLRARAVAQVALDQPDRLVASGGDLCFLLVQRLEQDRRQLDLGLAALIGVFGRVLRGGLLLLGRVRGRGQCRQPEQQRKDDRVTGASHVAYLKFSYSSDQYSPSKGQYSSSSPISPSSCSVANRSAGKRP